MGGKYSYSHFYGRDTVIEIDLDAVTHNIQQFINYLPTDTGIMAVVKADGYGHGAIMVAQAALEAGASFLGVAFVDEGIELRKAGIDAPILVLGYTPEHGIDQAIQYGLTLTVYSLESVRAINRIATQLGQVVKLHVKVDTGMGRIGLQPHETRAFIHECKKFNHIFIEGLYTHFATADESDKTYMKRQEKLFAQVVEELKCEGFLFPLLHTANSAGAIEAPDRVYNMIRLGISLYGYYPSAEVDRQTVWLQPALQFKSKVIHIKQLPAGTGVSYGKTYTTHGYEWIATIPVGYADGFSRKLSNRGFALINGVRVPVIGRVCMDQLMLDVTRAMPVHVGDEVVLYGKQGDENISIEEVAEQLDTINYEITCMLSHRIPRIYLRKGQPVKMINRLRQVSVTPFDRTSLKL